MHSMNPTKLYVHPTDRRWFDFLRQQPPGGSVNFWKPRTKNFTSLPPDEPLLFLLNKPDKVIAGVGYFAGKMNVTLESAWQIFGLRNGVGSYQEFYQLVYGNRYAPASNEATILCLTLNAPVFFDQADWLPAPPDWSGNLVQGKSYDVAGPLGQYLWQQVSQVLQKYQPATLLTEPGIGELLLEPAVSYGTALRQVRPDQRAFQAMVTQAYERKCAISGEKTLPVLEAAHIRPYAEAGPIIVSNGLLLRSDLHRLFDRHYLTINAGNLKVEVSDRIREEFSNGEEYYRFQGRKLRLPHEKLARPAQQFLQQHNERFRG